MRPSQCGTGFKPLTPFSSGFSARSAKEEAVFCAKRIHLERELHQIGTVPILPYGIDVKRTGIVEVDLVKARTDRAEPRFSPTSQTGPRGPCPKSKRTRSRPGPSRSVDNLHFKGLVHKREECSRSTYAHFRLAVHKTSGILRETTNLCNNGYNLSEMHGLFFISWRLAAFQDGPIRKGRNSRSGLLKRTRPPDLCRWSRVWTIRGPDWLFTGVTIEVVLTLPQVLGVFADFPSAYLNQPSGLPSGHPKYSLYPPQGPP